MPTSQIVWLKNFRLKYRPINKSIYARQRSVSEASAKRQRSVSEASAERQRSVSRASAKRQPSVSETSAKRQRNVSKASAKAERAARAAPVKRKRSESETDAARAGDRNATRGLLLRREVRALASCEQSRCNTRKEATNGSNSGDSQALSNRKNNAIQHESPADRREAKTTTSNRK